MHRIEKDMLGEIEIPDNVYWGIHTARALQNFPTLKPTHKALIKAYALVKKACILANTELLFINTEHSKATTAACDEISEGILNENFPIDALQGGAGTSTNMNLNEVIANRALEILGHPKGAYAIIDPLDHVNLHQSTNDTYPTALTIAALYKLKTLSDVCAKLQNICQQKEKDWSSIVIVGRTELRSAVPTTLGRIFSGYADAFGRDRWRTFKAEERIRQINLGGTAIGTGLAAPTRYIFLVTQKLQQLTGLPIARAENLIDQTMNADAYVEVSGILKAVAVNLRKLAQDLRIYNLLGEITLPALQAGSSIMPGKVNPVIAEAVIQAAITVCSEDQRLTEAASGSLQINEYMPLIADALLTMLDLLINSTLQLANYVEKTIANPQICQRNLAQATEIITAFVPQLGYAKCQELIKAASQQELPFLDFLEQQLGSEAIQKILSPQALNKLGYTL